MYSGLMKDVAGASDLSPESVKARIAAFCDWFGVEPPRLKGRGGSVCLNVELSAWLSGHGASWD